MPSTDSSGLLMLAVVAATALGCGSLGVPEGHFPCGAAGGSCEIDAEVCVVAGECSTCVPLPAPCAETPDCECLETAGGDEILTSGLESGACEEEEGLQVTCSASDPPFICG